MKLNKFFVGSEVKAEMLDKLYELQRKFKEGTHPPEMFLEILDQMNQLPKTDPLEYYARQALEAMPEGTDKEIYQKIEAMVLYYKYFPPKVETTVHGVDRALWNCTALAEKFTRKYWVLKHWYLLNALGNHDSEPTQTFDQFKQFNNFRESSRKLIDLTQEEERELKVEFELKKVDSFVSSAVISDFNLINNLETAEARNKFRLEYARWLIAAEEKDGRDKYKILADIAKGIALEDAVHPFRFSDINAEFYILVYKAYLQEDDLVEALKWVEHVTQKNILRIQLAEIMVSVSVGKFEKAENLLRISAQNILGHRDEATVAEAALIRKVFWMICKGRNQEIKFPEIVAEFKSFLNHTSLMPKVEYLLWLPSLSSELTRCLDDWKYDEGTWIDWEQAYYYVRMVERWLEMALDPETHLSRLACFDSLQRKEALEKAFSLVVKHLAPAQNRDVVKNKIELLGRIYTASRKLSETERELDKRGEL